MLEDQTQGLMEYVDASPTPFHAVEQAAGRLVAAGFAVLDERLAFPSEPGRYVLVRGGSLVAWVVPDGLAPTAPFRVLTAHTDSPNLRIKPNPGHVKAGINRLLLPRYEVTAADFGRFPPRLQAMFADCSSAPSGIG